MTLHKLIRAHMMFFSKLWKLWKLWK